MKCNYLVFIRKRYINELFHYVNPFEGSPFYSQTSINKNNNKN